jgi:hypothetical protein
MLQNETWRWFFTFSFLRLVVKWSISLCVFYSSCLLRSLTFLGAFAKLRKATVSFVMSVRLSVRMEQLGSHWTDFHEIWYWRIFRKSVEKIQVSLKSDKSKGYFTWRPIYIFLSYLADFFLEWEMFQTKAVEKIKTHILFSITFFLKSCCLWENMEKYCTAGQVTDGNMAHAHCMLET